MNIFKVKQDNKKVIKSNLRVILATLEMNQKELSELTGISRQTISSIVNNRTQRLEFDTLYKICTALNLDIGDLLTIKKK